MAMFKKSFQTFSTIAFAIAAFTLTAAVPAMGQAVSSLVTTRLTQPIDDNNLVTLNGTVHPLANARNDKGAASSSMPLERMGILLKRSPAQESALKELITGLHTPGNASYHKWLTPTQFGEQFGPSDQDVATIEAWLTSRGFQVSEVKPGKQVIEFSGNVGQLSSAFHTQIHKYEVNGETHYANANDPKIPTALAPVLGGFVSLNNFRLKTAAHVLGKATYNWKTDQATPEWTYGNNNGVNFVLAPGDFAVQYDLAPAYAAGVKGAGETIAIVNESNINVGLVNQYRTLFGLPANPPRIIIDGNDPGIDGINNPDGPNYASGEAYLDVEQAGAVAPEATVDLVIGADTSLESGLALAAEHAVYGNIAPIMSLSFGGCEQTQGSSNQFWSGLWQQAAAQGITVLVSTGDNGSAGCDDDNTQYYAVYGQAVSGIASTPYNVGVGGTDFYYTDYASGGASIFTYWNPAPTQQPATSLLKVVPEQPWNASQYGLNIVDYYDLTGATTIAAGSGGASNCATGSGSGNGGWTTCTGGYAKPSWQTGTGVPADSVRDLPDVSLFAAANSNYSYYATCAVDGDCQAPSGSNLVQITAVGGTSASTPSFAGIMALVDQKYGPQGQADFVLYPLKAQFPAAFHDVKVGTNSVPCATGTLDCIAVSNPITVTDPNLGTAVEGQIGSGTTPYYNAAAGYNLATGLGSVDANVLISDWNKVTFKSTTVTLTPSSDSFAHGTAINISGTVSGATPGGSVALMTDSTEPVQQGQTAFAVTSGAFSATGIAYLPGGTYNIWGQYSGDGSNAASTSAKTQITVTPEASSLYLTVSDVVTGYGYGPIISSGTTNIPYGTQLILSALPYPTTYYNQCVTPSSPPPTCSSIIYTQPTGTVAFSDSSSLINTAVVNAEGDAEYNAPWSVGSHSVTGSYSGDDSYNKSSASAFTFSIAKNTPEINLGTTITTTSGALVGGQATVLTIQVLNTANLNNESTYSVGYSNPTTPPTGTVAISGLPSGSPTTATLQPGIDGSTYSAAGIGTVAIPASTAAGNYSVTISYPGDTNYASTSASGTIAIQNVSGIATTTTATLTGSISPTTSVTLSGTVTGKSGSPAPSNGNGGVLLYSSGYVIGQLSVTAGTGDTSTFSTVLNSQNLLQGANAITVQYLGDSTYAPSADIITMPVSSPLADFVMVPETTIIPVGTSGKATDIVNVSGVNGFSGAVSLKCTASAGLSCSVNPASASVSGSGQTAATLTVTNTGAAVGTYNLLVTGTDPTGKFVHTLGIEVVISAAAAPGFTLSNSGTITIATAGGTGTGTITVTPTGGFTGGVSFTCATTSPSGATNAPTCSVAPATVTGAAAVNATLTVTTTASTPDGAYVVTVTGTDTATMTITATTTVPVNVGTVVTPGFTLSASPATLTLAPGASGTSTITVTPTGGFTGGVTFTCAVTGPSGAIDSPMCSVPATTGTALTSTLTVTTTAATSSALKMPLKNLFAVSGGVAVAGLLFFGIPARRRNWRSLLGLVLLAGIVGLGIGCGSSNSGGGGGSGGTTAGAYVLTVTGVDTATGKVADSTAATINLTVQ
jgi:hypothetical protein